MPLTTPQRRRLKALAQRLDPILRVGKAGLSDAFIAGLGTALAEHELVKVKFAEFKEEKKRLAAILAERTASELIMQVGNVVVLYRQHRDPTRRLLTGSLTSSDE
jgi:RNA-binding protein